MHSPTMSNDITRRSFWTQRLQSLDTGPSTPAFFDKEQATSTASNTAGQGTYTRTKAVMAVDAADLHEAALTHSISPETIVFTAWAVLLRSYTGEDGPVTFGVCLDREKAAWLSTMSISDDDKLLNTMRAAEQDARLTLDHKLSFHSLGAFAERTGCRDALTTAVFIRRDSKSDLQSFKAMATVFVNIVEGAMVHVHLNFNEVALSRERANSVVDNLACTLKSLMTKLLANSSRLDELAIQEIETTSRHDYNRIVALSVPLPLKLDDCVHDLIFTQCSKPEKAGQIAVESWDGNFTYPELASHVRRLAITILGATQRSNAASLADGNQLFVPFYLSNSKWTPVTILAILASGGICVPFEPNSPAVDILAQANFPIVLTTSTLRPAVIDCLSSRGLSKHIISVDHDRDGVFESSSKFPATLPYVQPEASCYVLYTACANGGSPKAVKWHHSAFSTSAWEHGREFHMDAQSRVLQFAPHTIDASVAELVTPLVHGGCVVIPSESERATPDELTAFMTQKNITCTLLPSSYSQILQPASLPSLKTLVVRGEAVGQDNVDKWAASSTLEHFIIAYGSVESCIVCSKSEISIRPVSQDHVKESIGRPVGSRILIGHPTRVDRLVPIGAVGEIIIESPTLSQGYLNNDKQTSTSFMENPTWVRKTHFYPASPRRRFWRSGDLGRQAMDGTITFVGRVDSREKLRGQTMDLSNIRLQIVRSFPTAVRVHVDVVAIGGERALTAFISFETDEASQHDVHVIQPDDDQAESIRTLISKLRVTLPSTSMPSFFIPVAKFPYLVSGKLDRLKLLSVATQPTVQALLPYHSLPTGIELSSPSSTDGLEGLILSCFVDILGLSSMGLDDNFFAAGGNSVLAIKAVTAARSQGIHFTTSDIFKLQNVRALAQVATMEDEDLDYGDIASFGLLPVDSVGEILENVKARGIQADDVLDVYPCTPIQEALVAVSSVRNGAYVAQLRLDLPEHVDIKAFQASWEAIVKKHDILRTMIVESQRGALQVVSRALPEWHTVLNLDAYCASDRNLPMGFGDSLVKFALVDRSFILSMHHSAFDAWSMTHLFEDVERHYAGQPLLDLRQYKVFVQHLSTLEIDESKEFWLSKLDSDAGLAACHYPETPASSYTPVPDSDMTIKLSTANPPNSQFTMATRIRAAWALLIGRYLDGQDVVFGETFSGRTANMTNMETVCGPTICTAPVRITWASDDTVNAFLSRIQADVVDIEDFGHLGVQNISRLSQAAHEACQFRHVIVIQPMRSSLRPVHSNRKPLRERIGLENASLNLRGYHSYALNMDFLLGDDGVIVTTTFDSGVFSEQQVQHLQAQFGHVLNQICGAHDPSQMKISDIDYASSMDTRLQMENNNKQQMHYPPTTLLQLFDGHVATWPNSPAVEAWDGKLSYLELDRASSAIAAHLCAVFGVRKGDHVPYCFPKSMWATVSILATLKIGAIAVALEPSYPDSSIEKVLSQIKPKLVLCSRDLSPRFRHLKYKSFAVDGDATRGLSQRSAKLGKLTAVEPGDMAFVVMTSGSTGEPKGIPLEHTAICVMAKQHGEVMHIDANSRILQFAAHVFDVSIGDLAIAVYHGACLCVPSDDDRMNDLAHAINSLRADRAWLTPTVASLISPAQCPTISWLSVGGEQLTQSCKDIWQGVPLVNVYGPAEVTNIGTSVQVSQDLGLFNIGYGNGVRVWVCERDDPHKLAPAGCIGELVFEGPNVASRGYLDNPELSERVFPEALSWSFGTSPQKPVRMYRSGDLARLNMDGSLDFQGRKDTQIKLRGQRIEITAVETALRNTMDEPVELAVDILAEAADDRNACLIAFLHLPERCTDITDKYPDIFHRIDIKQLAAHLRSCLAQVLPAHMVPTLFIPLRRLPKLVSGKIDRKSLRFAAANLTDEQISYYRVNQDAAKRMPCSEFEVVLQHIWATALRVPTASIGVDDHFVSLGGDSITAIKVAARARSQGMDQVNVASIFQHGTICKLDAAFGDNSKPECVPSAADLEGSRPKSYADIANQCGIPEDKIEDVFPCTALQEGMLMLTERNPTAYIAHHVMELSADVDLQLFRRVWQAISDENSILRTRIISASLQVVLRPAPVEWTKACSNDMAEHIQQSRQEKIGFGTALTHQSILQSPTRFVWTAHHSVYDGWSMTLLANSINSTYKTLLGRHSIPGCPSNAKATFKEFVEYAKGIDKQQARNFWNTQLDGADPAAFPPSLPSSYKPLADALMEMTIAFPRDVKSTMTISTFIRTAWAILIYAYSGSHHDVVFGATVTGRSVPLEDVLTLIGPTLATVPFRVMLDAKQSIRELMEYVQQRSFSMLDYEQYGLQNIKDSAPNAPAACDFKSLLVVHPEDEVGSQGGLFSWSSERSFSDFLTNALTLECQPIGSRLSLVASYDSSVMDGEQVRRILSTFEHILGQLCQSNLNTTLESIDTVSPRDRAEISKITHHLPPRVNDRVHDMFARQAAVSPDSLAVSAWDGDISYRQLDDLSTKLAGHLQILGVGPECFVPFCFEKSKWVPVTLLGILKAGGACVPLDPSQPMDRLQSILGTVDARHVVTSSKQADLLKCCTRVKHFVEVSEATMDRLPSSGKASINPKTGPDSACYSIFTSGSTGTPKGVVWDHATLCTSMVEHGAAFNYSATSRVLQFSSHTFDVSVSELLTTLMFGGCICIPDDLTRLNGISNFINEKGVNWTFFAPSFARLMDPASVPGLKTVVLGGEAPGKDNIERWSARSSLELIVTYGPAESCIYCAKNSVRGPQVDGNIGHSIGGMMWVADLGRPTELAPIGAIGEIVVEGNIVSRGYLRDSIKTKASFRPMPPKWAGGRSSRVYFTGDLGRINSDGTISCLGRRDEQVKVRGQRVELPDIEYHLRKDERIRQALVLYPRSGGCANHLVGILSMTETHSTAGPVSTADITLTSPEMWASTADVQERLASKVPLYMLPSLWIVLESIPLMPASQKVNRKLVTEWVINLDQATYEHIAGLSAGHVPDVPAPMCSKLQEQVREIWSQVLNVSPKIISPNTSFLRLGGDSISAMQVVTRCRNDGINVTVQDLLKAKTISDFCTRAESCTKSQEITRAPPATEQEDGSPFDLSPIQKWFTRLAPDGANHFNQSHLLRFTQDIKFQDLQDALLMIVHRHDMLRARFQRVDGRWQQRISTNARESIKCREFQGIWTIQKAISSASQAQECLDVVKGPLMAADLYHMTDGAPAMFITCHHLVVDLVSWRIILQELEDILWTGKLNTVQQPLPFRAWCRLLNDRVPSSTTAALNMPSSDLGFWGVEMADNTAAHITEQGFSLDDQTTATLLGPCNDAFNTEPLDLLLTAVAHSFNQVFCNIRGPVVLFNEGHGREPWRPDLDLSSTIGWFTSMSPITLSAHQGDAIRSLVYVKDTRRRITEKGLPFFTSFAQNASCAVEVTFNYFGLYQQLERDGALLKRMSWAPFLQPSDFGPDAPRFSLFDVSAGIENGVLSVNFAFSDKIKHRHLIQQWIEACSDTLRDLVQGTSQRKYQSLTLSDLPRLPVTYDELSGLLETTLPDAGVSIGDIQDIYPCSPMQTALLVSQAMDPTLYAVRYVWEVSSRCSNPLSVDGLVMAWRQVVNQHPMLRTHFVQATSSVNNKDTSIYYQVVVKHVEPNVVVCETDDSTLSLGQPEHRIQNGPPHNLVLCQQASGKIKMQLDISHTLIDGMSVNILLDHLVKAYDGDQQRRDEEAYGNYISYLGSQDTDASRVFWMANLEGVEPCHFPGMRKGTSAQVETRRHLRYLDFKYPSPTRLHAQCANFETTAASVYKLAWALVLRVFTGNNAPCFGFLASGRDLPIQGINSCIGPFINMLVCKIGLENDGETVDSTLRRTHADYANCLSHQLCSLAEIQRGLELGGAHLFNTALSVQRLPRPGTDDSTIELQQLHAEDPSEFDIALNIGDSPDSIDISLTYNNALLSDSQAQSLASIYNKAIDGILDSMSSPIRNISLLTNRDQEQILAWNSSAPPAAVSACCDELISHNAALHPDKRAVSSRDLSVSYSELDVLTGILAGHLISRYSLGPSTLVPFCFEKSGWAIVAMMGIMKAGAAFVPLDPNHAVDRLESIARRVKAPLILSSPANEEMVSRLSTSLQVPYLVVGPQSVAAMESEIRGTRKSLARNPSDLAYCLFTSGSTGTPKGVLIQHEALFSGVSMHGEKFGYNSDSRTLQFASYGFDACITEIFTTLAMGGCVCVPSEDRRTDKDALMRFVNFEKVSHALFTPSVLALLDPEKTPALTTLILGGETAGHQVIERWRSPSRRVHIAFGPTECTVICAGGDFSDPGSLQPGRNLIGNSVGCVSWIVDPRDHNSLVPIGAVGELLVEGPILAKGYLDDSAKTMEAFVVPAWMEHGRRAYKTGDLVRYQEDGSLEYLGRRDTQVILRGQRLKLGEIEEQLIKHDEVQQCAVVLAKEGPCKQTISAVITIKPESASGRKATVAGQLLCSGSSDGLDFMTGKSISIIVASIGQHLAGVLPSFMMPSCWIVTSRLPLLASGKTDRRLILSCISNMTQEMHQLSTGLASIVEDLDEAEKEISWLATNLRQIWSGVLNMAEKSINLSAGSFVKTGGDSISAMEVVAQARARGIPLSVEQLLKAKSITQLASNFEQVQSQPVTEKTRAGNMQDEAVDDEENITLFPLSPIQRMFTQLSPGENHFNQSFLMKASSSKSRLSEDNVRRALDVIVRRHAMLRARFQKFGRSFKQWIEPVGHNSYAFASWEFSRDGNFSTEAVERIQQTQQSLNVEMGPMLAGDLLHIGHDQYIFLTAHHLVIDLVSWRIVLKDLEDFLTTGSITSYRSLSFEKWCSTLNTYRNELLDGPPCLPFDLPTPDYKYWGWSTSKPNYATDFEHHHFSLPATTSQSLLGHSNDVYGTEPLDLFISALMHSFAATFPDRDIPPIFNEGHGREPWDESIDLSQTVGWFTTIAPVWVNNQECNRDILEYVKRIRDVRSQTLQKGFSYFTSLDLERQPFNIEVSFNYFGSFQQLDRPDALLNQVHWRNIGVDPFEVSEKHTKFSLIDINAETENGQLVFTFSFNSKIDHADDVQRWIANSKKSLEHMARVLGSREFVSDHLTQTHHPKSLPNSMPKELGLVQSDVEDIYPCSPSQQGMLLSQTKDPQMYWFRSVYEMQSAKSTTMTMEKIRQAWRCVVQYHAVLRTVFCEQDATDGLYDQMVLRKYEPDIIEGEVSDSLDEAGLINELRSCPVPEAMLARRVPQHQLRIVRQASTNRIFCSFLLSHAIVDGGSMAVVLRHLSIACEGRLLSGNRPLLKDYVTYLKSRDGQGDIGHWKKSLEDLDPCFLPNDAPLDAPKVLGRTDVPSSNINYARVQSAARGLGVSLFTFLQVTWALTLREYINPDRDDCCFGIVTSGRDLPVKEIHDIVGPLVNILVSRIALPHDQPISCIAETVHESFIDNLAHQTSSLAEITHELGSGNLFNTGMSLQKASAGGEVYDVSWKAVGGQDPTEFDVVVQALDDSNSLKVHLSYWCHKVSAGRAREMASTMASILSQIAQNPDIRPSELHIVSDEDVQQLWSWNANLPPAVEMRIEDMICQQVVEHPQRDALWSTGEVISYQQLDLLSTRLAQGILADVEREEVVPLCFEKSVWVAVAMLATLKAGGTILLLDPSHPTERLKYITTTVKAKRILASPSQSDMCTSNLGLPTVAISKDMLRRRSGPSGTTATPPMGKRALGPSTDAAYYCFTSGSTGQPKASVTEHRSFCTATQGYHRAIGQLSGERVLQFASYSFDASFLEILGSLMVGATVCVPNDKERSNQLVSFMNKSRTTFAVITPTVASLLSPEEVPTLSCLALCGEPMTATHISTWASSVRLVNAFGPSECCVGSAANSPVKQTSSPKCIGKAVSCCYWVVHPRNHHRLSRIGSVGELLIEGNIIARHYLNEPAKTKATFITNPEWAKPGRGLRLYKTGDLVFQNPDGSFQYVGRKDTQAKIRGQRLEFGDVEQAFRDVVPETETVVADIIQPGGQAARLVVFFSSRIIGRDKMDTDKIQLLMGEKVPSYMVPTTIVPLEEIPTMPSGKVDRKKIKALGASLATRQGKQVNRSGRHPKTEMEIELASMWKETLKSAPSQIMADDSFFQVGGDSYTAMKLVTSARGRGISLSVATVMQSPKLQDMACKATCTSSVKSNELTLDRQAAPFTMIDWSSSAAAEVARQCSVPLGSIEDVYPCTPLQEGVFVLSAKQPGAYVAQHCYQLPVDLDIARYKDAWATVYASSAILRTLIVQLDHDDNNPSTGSGLYQAVVKKPITWNHATSLDHLLASKPAFAFGTPLAQFTIVKSESQSYVLVLTMHHAAYDAACLRMLLESVEMAYKGEQPPHRPPFKQFIKYLHKTQVQVVRDFWTYYLDGAKASTFPGIPLGYVPSADSTFDHTIPLPQTSSKVHTLSTFIRVAWGLVLARQSGTNDVVFGETLSGRNASEDELSEVEGPLITTIPVRYRLDGEDEIRTALSSAQARMIDVIPYQHVGLQNIRFMSESAAEASRFTCLITIAPPSSATTDIGLGIVPIDVASPPVMSYPLSIQFILGEGNDLTVSVSHDHHLVDGVLVRNLVAQFDRVLSQLCKGEKKAVKEIEVEVESTFSWSEVGDGNHEPDALGVLHGEIEDVLDETSSPELSKGSSSASSVSTPASVGLEREMAKVWADILRMDALDIVPGDNFFQLGGDSISAMKLVSRAAHKGIKVSVADIFTHPTLEELCDFASHESLGANGNATVDLEPALQHDYQEFGVINDLGLDRGKVLDTVCNQLEVFPADVEDIYPATDYQAWAISHGLMRSRGNTNYFLFRLHGDLDTFRLEQACRSLVSSNPILRTLFTTIGGQVMQVVLRSYQVEFLRFGQHRADDAFVRWLVEQDTQRSAYLTQSIVRFKLVLHRDGHYVLIMRMSHAQYDGESLPLLVQGMEECYNSKQPKLRPSFGSFIQAATSGEEGAIDFWEHVLEGSHMTDIVEHSGPSHKHNVDTIRTRVLPAIPSNVAGMSQATLVKAAWALTLAKMSGQRDVVFGNLIFGRNMALAGIEDIAGPCINIIPVRIQVNAMDSIHDLLALVHEQQVAAMPHESLGFRRMIKHCTDWPEWKRFSSVLQHQQMGRDGAQGQEFNLADNVKCEMGVLGPSYDSADLWVQTTPHDDSFKVEIGSCSSVVSPSVAETLLDKLCTTLSIFATNGTGGNRPLWELLARDGPPLIPIKSSVVDEVWTKVLDDAESIPWDTPYFEVWGDEIAPVRFLEEYAEHGIRLDMENILENPTKQAQMMLTSRILSDRERRGIPSPRRSPQSATTTASEQGFFMLGSQSTDSRSSKGGHAGSSKSDGSWIGSPLIRSPQMGIVTKSNLTQTRRRDRNQQPRSSLSPKGGAPISHPFSPRPTGTSRHSDSPFSEESASGTLASAAMSMLWSDRNRSSISLNSQSSSGSERRQTFSPRKRTGAAMRSFKQSEYTAVGPEMGTGGPLQSASASRVVVERPRLRRKTSTFPVDVGDGGRW